MCLCLHGIDLRACSSGTDLRACSSGTDLRACSSGTCLQAAYVEDITELISLQAVDFEPRCPCMHFVLKP